MSRELTWVEAASAVLENSTNVWMTAPDLVREIHKTGIRELKSAHPQAVRSLRSALNFQSHKENGLFSRKEEEYSVYFALKRRLKGSGNGSKVPNKIHSGKMTPHARDKEKSHHKTKPQSTPSNPPLVNGLPPHPPPLPLHSLVPPQPYTIEIDPSLKYTPQSSGLSNESVGNFCLPSPRQSILGPIRTLHIFNESNSTNHRPVRQARMRKSLKDQENSSPDAMMTNSVHESLPIHPALAPPPVCEVLRLETCHSVPALLSEVVCVRYPSTSNSTSRKSSMLDEDPCKVQGERKCSGKFEIQLLDHCYVPTSSESELDEEDDNDDDDDDDITSMDTQSESEEAESCDRVLLQPTPRQQLIMPKPLRRLSSSSSCSEGLLKIDESLLARESSQSQSESSILSPTKQTRGYGVDVGRITTGANGLSSGRANPRSMEPRSLEGVVKKSAANSDYAALDQRRYVSSLFQPTSPLVGENMKLLLNMSAYRGLTEYQKRKLRSLLPSIDRGGIESSPGGIISESSFSNAFFSSALREWQEHVALGSFTPEYKAKMRGEEKRRLAARAEELWKQKFYEENWGEKKEGAEDQRDSFPVPYYPHSQQLAADTPSAKYATEDCLRAILDAYHGKGTKQKEELTPSSLNSTSVPSNPPPPPSSSCDSSSLHSPITSTPTPAPAPVIKPPPSAATSKERVTTGRKEKSSAQISRNLNSPRKTNKTTKSSSTSLSKNHLIKKPAAARSQASGSKNLLPSLLKSKPKVSTTAATVANKKVAVNKKTAVKRLGVSTKSQQAHSSSSKALGKAILHSMRNQSTGLYLTRLPPKLPYQTLLSALEQASKDNTALKNKNTDAPTATAAAATVITSYTPPSYQHNHSVFHDHFSLLSNEHVPTEFSLPITSLPIKLPRDMYRTCLRAKIVLEEHSYSKQPSTGSSSSSNSNSSGNESVTVVPSSSVSHLHQLVQKKRPQEQRHREVSVAGLKLSLPRSLIRTKENCECDGRALVFCSRCHSLYHTECVGSSSSSSGGGTLCPRCVTIASLLS